MSKKKKGVKDLCPLYGGEVYWDARARFKYQSLMQDYLELQKEAVLMKSKLDTSKQRKRILATEVRFLRKRYKLLMRAKTMNSLRELSYEQPPNSLNRNKTMKEQNSCRKDANIHRLPPIPEPKPKKKNHISKEVTLRRGSPAIDWFHKPISHVGYKAARSNLIPVTDTNHKGRTNLQKKTLARNRISVLDLNPQERFHSANDASSWNSIGIFDVNQDSFLNGKEASLPRRAPVFDLNEISTGDEEFQINNQETVKLEEARKNLSNGVNDEHQNELKMSICRDAGEGSSHGRKRKISWLDPVALKV